MGELVLTIDSGDPMGWALWLDRELQQASSCGLDVFKREWLERGLELDLAIYELPNFVARGSVEDITRCGARGGEAAGWTRAREIRNVTPMKWKGQVPKKIMIERIQGSCTAIELARVRGKASHCWDAIGLGLSHFGRLNLF